MLKPGILQIVQDGLRRFRTIYKQRFTNSSKRFETVSNYIYNPNYSRLIKTNQD